MPNNSMKKFHFKQVIGMKKKIEMISYASEWNLKNLAHSFTTLIINL